MSDSHKIFVNGQWSDTASNFDVINPADQTVFARAANAGLDETRAAIEAAAAAQADWADLPYTERAKFMWRTADIVEKRQQEIAGALVAESGSWIGKAMFECSSVSTIFRAAAAAAYQVTGDILPSEHGKISMAIRKPLGVISVISPWNFPMLLSARGIAIALAVGNTVVLKPSEETPVTGGVLLAECLEEAGIPAGVINMVTCSRENVIAVGDELVSNTNVKAISFTGSTAVGRQIGARAGGLLKKVTLELGGKDVIIVMDDADMTLAVNATTFGCFMHQGQICMSAERLIVHEDVAEEFTERLVSNVKTLGVGDPREMGNVIGPIINEKQLQNIHGQVEDAIAKGATIETGGSYHGLYYEPTVISGVTADMKVFSEETFGPVAPIITVANENEAVAIANDSNYGLSAGIITADEERGMEIAKRLETGMAHVNDSPVNDEQNAPFGGAKDSGMGRHNGKASIEACTEVRWLTIEKGGRHYPPPFIEKG